MMGNLIFSKMSKTNAHGDKFDPTSSIMIVYSFHHVIYINSKKFLAQDISFKYSNTVMTHNYFKE